MQQYYFNMSVSYEECQRFYRGQTKFVLVTDDNGKKIQLLFSHFRPYIDSLGIRGRFRLTLTKQATFVQLEKIN
ncbi:DUF2835 family protein [Rheinheimera sp. WS51]|uniref:DUF2835 family protein n=1 Tax=Rheinheimera sp. WS51 TaxID=3425886 RepID=UPI003D94FBE3